MSSTDADVEKRTGGGAQRFGSVGSAYTLITLPDGGPVLFVQTIQDYPPKPQRVGTNVYGGIEGSSPEAGRLVLRVIERWSRHILEEFNAHRGRALAINGPIHQEVTRMLGSHDLEVSKVIKGPGGHVRVVRYRGAVITSTNIEEPPTEIEIMYTHITRHGD